MSCFKEALPFWLKALLTPMMKVGQSSMMALRRNLCPPAENPAGLFAQPIWARAAYWYWNAPAEFLGDKSAAYNGSLTFYLNQSAINLQRDRDDIIFTGGGYTLVYNTAYNPGTTWTYYSIPINETSSEWMNQTTGLIPTQAEMLAVLTSLESIRIRGEYRYGADIGGIDSVYLNSTTITPTPTFTLTNTQTSTPTRTPTIPPTSTLVTSCHGDTCDGLNPLGMGCGADAILYTSKPLYIGLINVGFVENRYSPACLAQWERTRNTSSFPLYAEGSIRWGGVDYTPGIWPVSGLTSDSLGWSVYTQMYAVDAGIGPSLNCGKLSQTAVTPPPQPINLNSPYGLNNCVAR